MKRSENGITIIALAVIIAVILMISGVAIYQGLASYRESKKLVFVADLELIQRKVNELYAKGESVYESLGDTISPSMRDKMINEMNISETIVDDFRYFSAGDLKDIGVDGTSRENIVINFKTRDVYDLDGIYVDGITYYRREDMPGASWNVEYNPSGLGEITFNLTSEKIDLERYKISVINIIYGGKSKEGTIYYKLDTDTGWRKAQSEDFIVLREGTYEVKIIDKSGLESEIKEITVGTNNLASDEIPIYTQEQLAKICA